MMHRHKLQTLPYMKYVSKPVVACWCGGTLFPVLWLLNAGDSLCCFHGFMNPFVSWSCIPLIGFGKSSKSSCLSILTNHSPFSCFNMSSSFLAFICGDDKFWRLGLQDNCHRLVIHKLRGWWWPGWWWDSSNDQGIAGDKDPTSCPRRWWWHWIQGLWSVSIDLLLQSIFEQRDELRFHSWETLWDLSEFLLLQALSWSAISVQRSSTSAFGFKLAEGLVINGAENQASCHWRCKGLAVDVQAPQSP